MDLQSQLVPGGAEAQTRQALDNLRLMLEASGASLEAVVKTTILLARIEDFQAVNQVYAECKYKSGISTQNNMLSNNIKLVILSTKSKYSKANRLQTMSVVLQLNA